MAEPIFSVAIQDKELRDRLTRLAVVSSDLGKLRLVVGTNRAYMRKHQLGLGGLPKRVFLGVSKQDKIEALKIIDRVIANPVENGGRLALQEIGEMMLLSTDTRWEQEIDPDGKPWVRNSAFTLRLKKAKGRILKVLQDTGNARGDIHYQILGG